MHALCLLVSLVDPVSIRHARVGAAAKRGGGARRVYYLVTVSVSIGVLRRGVYEVGPTRLDGRYRLSVTETLGRRAKPVIQYKAMWLHV